MRGSRSTIGGRRGAVLLSGAAVLLSLAACTSSGSSGGLSTSGTTRPGNSAGSTDDAPSKAAAAAAALTFSTRRGHAISPSRPVVVKATSGTLTAVTMTNSAGRTVNGQISSDGKSWHNTEVLGYSKTYRITAVAKNADGVPVTKHSKITTVTPNNLTQPYLDDIYGSSLDNGATYGIGMVARVHFDEPIPDRAAAERSLHVATTPSVVGSWYWQNDQDVLWRPKSYYQPGTKVTVSAKVYGVDVGNGLYGQSDQSISFKIGAKHVSVANGATHHVRVYFDDKLVRNMPTSMGRGGTLTGDHGQPIYLWTMPGIYTVLGFENPATMSSDSYGLPVGNGGYGPLKVPYSTKISTDGIYLHELDSTVWAQGHSNVSHGCLNLNYDNAKWFFTHSRVGDIVIVTHSGGPKIQQWQGGDWSVPWSEWVKGSALS